MENTILVIFSGNFSSAGGIQSWAHALKASVENVQLHSLKCTKRNLHYPAFRRLKRRIVVETVVCCDPLSLLWVSRNVLAHRLIIGAFHKDEWRINDNSKLEKALLKVLQSADVVMCPEYYRLPDVFGQIPRKDLPLYPRSTFRKAEKVIRKGKDIIVLGRLEKFKGFPVYLPLLADKVAEISPDIKIHVVGKGELFEDLLSESRENMHFHGFLDEMRIIELSKLCFIGLSSGLSAVELSSIGLPVAIAREDNEDMLLTSFTGDGNFIFQDDFSRSKDLHLLELLKDVYNMEDVSWIELSKNAARLEEQLPCLGNVSSSKRELITPVTSKELLFSNYLIRVVLDVLGVKRFEFLNRIP